MAKKVQTKSTEEILWDAANKLRGSIEPSEYKHVVLSLIFLKFASDKFIKRREELKAEGKEAFLEIPEFYQAENVFYLPEESRWEYIIENAKQEDITLKVDTALKTIERTNKSLEGALPDNYFSRLGLDQSKFSALLDTINNIDTLKDEAQDIVGRVYEYFLSKFAIAEGKGKGEFYTPKSIVNLIAEMIEPYKGKIYDPSCGSGGMFVQSLKFIEKHQGNKKDISIYGQELTNTTFKLAKMNLAIRGISANLGNKAADTFADDQHKELKADYIMANPPFNLKDWRAENELTDDSRWTGYEVPPKSNANYAWILNMISKLSQNGVAGFILANGALSGGGEEYKIRKQIIENDLVEAIVILPQNMFYSTDISVTLWILNRNKTERTVEVNDGVKNYRNREGEVLFMDLRQKGEPFEKKFIQFAEQEIEQIAATYHNWQQKDFETTYANEPEYCYSATLEEIRKKDYSLVPSKYIAFVNRDENIDYDTKMQTLQTELKDLFQQEETLKQEVANVFKSLGYEL
ncbi:MULTISPECIES: type I restriction-modification system subunit M [Empedobacter]|uniref:site-specific DNA-methyltransferase (adenine-specific) n=1 Tax=Empedobacter falsenii TaxID=343874 RepID=A0A427BG00_9FLAO|nr:MULTISPECIES: type I restriction-modification system subunit M [Empedobacter]MDH0660566.1 type I restriction-modification system subunit M [Empedobacter sp. GD03865]MDH0675544.1 type I restriction-modification system subunit M [Empedobacter sp. GD03861]RRT86558.1 DNA methyltransferase [Empedobacter falsenii]RRT87891.1 DNA methyltransferase [Empedobacter falsenii]